MESENTFSNANKRRQANNIVNAGVNVLMEIDKIFTDIETDGTFDCTMLKGLTLREMHQVVQCVDSITKKFTAIMLNAPALASNSKWMVILRTLIVLQNDVLQCYGDAKKES